MANLYFIGETDAHWDDLNNWATSSGGTTHPAAAPTSSDDCFLDGSSPACTTNGTSVCKSLTCTSYTNTFTLGADLDVYGAITLVAGMTFTPSTYKVSLKATANCSIASGGQSYYAFTITSNSGDPTFTLGDDLTINNTFTISGAATVNYTINGNNINAKGDVTIDTNPRNISGTTAFKINGSGNQTISLGSNGATYGIKLPITFASTGGTVTFAAGTHRIGGNLSYTSGTIDFTTNSSTVAFNNNSTPITISGAYTFYNLSFVNHTDPTFTISNDLVVNGDFVFGLSGSRTTLNGSNIDVKGNFTLASGNTGSLGTTTFTLSGSGTQTLNLQSAGSSYYCANNITITNSGTVNFANVTHYYYGNLTFNGTGAYNLVGTLSYKTGTITYTAGTVDAGTSTLSIPLACTLNTNGISWYAIDFGANLTLTLSSNLTFSNNWNNSNKNITLSGNYAIICNGTSILKAGTGLTMYNFTINSGKTVHLTSGQTFTVSNVFAATGTDGNVITLDSTTPDSTATLTVTNGVSLLNKLAYINATDINSASGSGIYYESATCTIDNCANWLTGVSNAFMTPWGRTW